MRVRESVRESERESENESEKENVNENENENKNDDVNDSDDNEIKQINDCFKMIDETKSFEEQINLLRKIDYLNEYWHMCYYDDDKELNLKIFMLKLHTLQKTLTKSYLKKYLVIHLQH